MSVDKALFKQLFKVQWIFPPALKVLRVFVFFCVKIVQNDLRHVHVTSLQAEKYPRFVFLLLRFYWNGTKRCKTGQIHVVRFQVWDEAAAGVMSRSAPLPKTAHYSMQQTVASFEQTFFSVLKHNFTCFYFNFSILKGTRKHFPCALTETRLVSAVIKHRTRF